MHANNFHICQNECLVIKIHKTPVNMYGYISLCFSCSVVRVEFVAAE